MDDKNYKTIIYSSENPDREWEITIDPETKQITRMVEVKKRKRKLKDDTVE